MITIQCTKKLQVKFEVDTNGLLREGREILQSAEGLMNSSPLSGWHANLITIQRRNCVLMVHNKTRFPLFMIGLTKKDFDRFDYIFADSLMNTLLKAGANHEQMEAAQIALAPVSIQKTSDRSVLGTINRATSDIEHMLWFDNVGIMDLSAYKTGAWLSGQLNGVQGGKEYVKPSEEMFKLLDEVVTPEIRDSDHCADIISL
jgi:hypothetical protein